MTVSVKLLSEHVGVKHERISLADYSSMMVTVFEYQDRKQELAERWRALW